LHIHPVGLLFAGVVRPVTAGGHRDPVDPRLAEAGMTAPVMRERDGELGG
jgi:hypothetical protein